MATTKGERRRVDWSGWAEKARYLDAGASLDSLAPAVRTLAMQIAGDAASALDALERLFLWVRDRIRYVNDAGGEDFADTLAIVAKGSDDCDGKSRALVALVRALAAARPDLGLEARILPVLRKSPIGDAFVHVQALCRGRGSETHPLAEPGGWLLCELTLRGVPLGAGVEAASRDAKTGRLDVA